MSIFKKSTKTEVSEQNLSRLEITLRLNPRYFEERELHKIRRSVKGYM
ncbi:MAG: hypothetical protein ACXAAH_15385 [Promethearchaeota archaeon]|jgi:hypothetical protein